MLTPGFVSAAVLLINVVIASLLLGLMAVTAVSVARRAAYSWQYRFLSMALLLTLTCPLLIGMTDRQGFGWLGVSAESLVASEAPPHAPLPINDFVPPRPAQNTDSAEHSIRTPAEEIKCAQPIQVRLANNIALAHSSGQSALWYQMRPILRTLGISLAVVWFAVSFWRSLFLLRGLRVLRRFGRSMRPACNPRLSSGLTRLPAPLAHRIPVYESDLAPAPLTIGWFRAAIVMPTGLAETLSDEELAGVLAHESAHAIRRDNIMALAQQFALIFYWWNPLLLSIHRRMNSLREQICDDWAFQRLQDGRPLAHAIVKVVEWSSNRSSAHPLVSTLFDDHDDLEGRVLRLVDRDDSIATQPRWPSQTLIGIVGCALVFVALCPVIRLHAKAPPAVEQQNNEWTVRVHVIDPDGQPVLTSQIGIKLGSDAEVDWQNSTVGEVTPVTLPSRTPPYCYLYARANGFAPMRAFWRNSKDLSNAPLPAEFTFRMTRAIDVGGKVRDEDNRPVIGATVLFSASSSRSNQMQDIQIGPYAVECRTDEQGYWHCDQAPEAMEKVHIQIKHPDYVTVRSPYLGKEQISEVTEQRLIWKLKKGFSVEGRVVDSQSNPIGAATLVLSELNTTEPDGPFAITDSDGRYKFEHVLPSTNVRNDDDPIRFTVAVVKAGFAPAMQSVPGYGGRRMADSTKERRIVDFSLKRGVKLTLKVVDSQNQPVEGTWIFPSNWRDTRGLTVLSRFGIPRETDKNGIWSWENAPTNEIIEYDILKRDFADVRKYQIHIGYEAFEDTIQLKKPQIIRGTVIDAQTRDPISDFAIQQAFEDVAGHVNGLSWTAQHAVGRNGSYRWRITMPPHNGSYTYRAVAAGYEHSAPQSIAFNEGETEVNFELNRPTESKPTPEISDEEKAKRAERKARQLQIEKEREERLAKVEPKFSKIYYLAPGEVVHHVPEPLNLKLRTGWYNAFFGPDENEMHIVTLCLKWEKDRATWESATVGTTTNRGVLLRSLLSMMHAVSPQFVEGDEELLTRIVPGDFVFDPKASADEVVAALESILKKQWRVPVTLRFRDVKRETYVVQGEWDFEPISDEYPGVQIYGNYLNKNSGSGGGSGTLKEFLLAAGGWINRPMINEVTSPPTKEFSWRFHMPSPFTKIQDQQAHEPESVTENLANQTGLTFTAEERSVRILFVELGK